MAKIWCGRVALALAAVIAADAAAQPQVEKILTWKFKPDEIIQYSRSFKREEKKTVQEKRVTDTVTRSVDYTLKVDKVNDDGSAQITATIDRVKFRHDTKGTSERYDSDRDSTSDGRGLNPDQRNFKVSSVLATEMRQGDEHAAVGRRSNYGMAGAHRIRFVISNARSSNLPVFPLPESSDSRLALENGRKVRRSVTAAIAR